MRRLVLSSWLLALLIFLAALSVLLAIGVLTSKHPNYEFSLGHRHLYIFLEPAIPATPAPSKTVSTAGCSGCTFATPADTPFPIQATTPGVPFLEVEGPIHAVCVANLPVTTYPSMFHPWESPTPAPTSMMTPHLAITPIPYSPSGSNR